MSSVHAQPQHTRERVVHDPAGVRHTIRAVKRGLPLRGDVDLTTGSSTVVEFAIGFVLDVVVNGVLSDRAASQPAWKIGVFRRRRWRERLVHRERLAPGEDLEARIRAIGADVSAGRRVARG